MQARLAVLFTLCTLIASCGWHLRGFTQYNSIDRLSVVSEDRFGPLTLAVQDVMQQRSIVETDQARWQLVLGKEELRRRTVAVTAIGSASQYELTLTVPFRYRNLSTDETSLPRLVTSTRVYDFDFRNTVAKTEEEQVLIGEMRRELAQRILQLVPQEDDGQTQP